MKDEGEGRKESTRVEVPEGRYADETTEEEGGVTLVTTEPRGLKPQTSAPPRIQTFEPVGPEREAGGILPWLPNYDGPEELAEMAERLIPPPTLQAQLVAVPGGATTTSIQTLPTGEVDIVRVVRTRYATANRGGACMGCGRPWPRAVAAETTGTNEAPEED